MDADGELFRNALKASPDIIKPNQVELEEYIGADYRLPWENSKLWQKNSRTTESKL